MLPPERNQNLQPTRQFMGTKGNKGNNTIMAYHQNGSVLRGQQAVRPTSNGKTTSTMHSVGDRRQSSASFKGPALQASNGFGSRRHTSAIAVTPIVDEKGRNGTKPQAALKTTNTDAIMRSSVRSKPHSPSKGINGAVEKPLGISMKQPYPEKGKGDVARPLGRDQPPQISERRVPSSKYAHDASVVNGHQRPRPLSMPRIDARSSTEKRTIQSSAARTRPARAEETTPSRAASGKDVDRKFKAPFIFDMFFDIPHPAASKDSAPARMIEPPEPNNAILSELYEPASISRLARLAFPEHDDHKHAINNVRTQPVGQQMKIDRNFGGRGRHDHLNRLDIYVLGYRSARHTFAFVLSDGVTKLYCHVLRYLPVHIQAKARADIGRRGVRAMIILTRATGGDKFYTSVLKSTESVMLQGDSLAKPGYLEDRGQEKAVRLLHGLHRRHSKIYSGAMSFLSRAEKDGTHINADDLDDIFLTLPAVEYEIKEGAFIQDRTLPGDYVKLQLPQSLQAGFQMDSAPGDIDAPILPLLRSLGPGNTMYLISAMMCERKVILVSADAGHLSTCIRGASSLLAQGHLVWQYNQVPVLPPHMMSCLKVKKPFLVGLLDDYIDDLESLKSLSDVLCIHLDKNLIRTFGMANPGKLIPDITSKDSQKSGTGVLLNDMEQILKAEKRIWGDTDVKASEKEEKTVSAVPLEPKVTKKKKGKGEAIKIETNIALLFGKVMRGDVLSGDDDISIESSVFDEANDLARLDKTSGHVPRILKKSDRDSSTLTTFDICENERGEEGLRAALTFFFLVTHGELGTMLTEHNGTFLLDRKKYLLAKKQTGSKEDSTMFLFYRQFSGTAMFQQHLSQRMEEFQQGRSHVMPRHRSLFSLCERHLRTKKVEFTFPNIRMLISKTTVHTPHHALVERSEITRARALALTSPQPFEGNIALALSSLMQDCHQCDIALPQIMAVVWSRLDDRRANGWKLPLLGLHLLKNLLLHGPITALSYSMDGADKVRKLRLYSMAKNAENNKEVQDSSQFVWHLMMDRPRLLLRRQGVVSGRAKLNEIPQGTRWGNYLIKKVPFNTDFREYHTLLRPNEKLTPCFMKQKSGTGVPDICQTELLRMNVVPHAGGEKGIAAPRPSPVERGSSVAQNSTVSLSDRPISPVPRPAEHYSVRPSYESQCSTHSRLPAGRERNCLKQAHQPLARGPYVNGEFRQYSPKSSSVPAQRPKRIISK